MVSRERWCRVVTNACCSVQRCRPRIGGCTEKLPLAQQRRYTPSADAVIAWLAARQHGLATLAQLLAAGLIARRSRAGSPGAAPPRVPRGLRGRAPRTLSRRALARGGVRGRRGRRAESSLRGRTLGPPPSPDVVRDGRRAEASPPERAGPSARLRAPSTRATSPPAAASRSRPSPAPWSTSQTSSPPTNSRTSSTKPRTAASSTRNRRARRWNEPKAATTSTSSRRHWPSTTAAAPARGAATRTPFSQCCRSPASPSRSSTPRSTASRSTSTGPTTSSRSKSTARGTNGHARSAPTRRNERVLRRRGYQLLRFTDDDLDEAVTQVRAALPPGHAPRPARAGRR